MKSDVICIGSVLWDYVGRAERTMKLGADVPGRIKRIPGGVAMNIAMTLTQFDLQPVLLTYVGQDSEGDELMQKAQQMGLNCDHVYRSSDLPTDCYMAIEAKNGLIAAVADAHSLEAAGDKILSPIASGTLSLDAPVALDGNLTADLLDQIAGADAFRGADLRIAPASPGKVERLANIMTHPSATLYLNLAEASSLAGDTYQSTQSVAKALVAAGANRVLVTDGGVSVSEAAAGFVQTRQPPSVEEKRVTGAGDTFMAAHIAAEISGADRESALDSALIAAAKYVSGNAPV